MDDQLKKQPVRSIHLIGLTTMKDTPQTLNHSQLREELLHDNHSTKGCQATRLKAKIDVSVGFTIDFLSTKLHAYGLLITVPVLYYWHCSGRPILADGN